MNYEKLLKAYMLHVCWEEGTPFASLWDKTILIELGLTPEEAERVIALANEAYEAYKSARQ